MKKYHLFFVLAIMVSMLLSPTLASAQSDNEFTIRLDKGDSFGSHQFEITKNEDLVVEVYSEIASADIQFDLYRLADGKRALIRHNALLGFESCGERFNARPNGTYLLEIRAPKGYKVKGKVVIIDPEKKQLVKEKPHSDTGSCVIS